MKIKKEQISKIHNLSSLEGKKYLRELFPKVFEVKPKLEVGKWYKGNVDFDSLIYITGLELKKNMDEFVYTEIKYYGFCNKKYYLNDTICNIDHEKSLVEATEQEIFEALKSEWEKRAKKYNFSCIDLDGKIHTNCGFVVEYKDGCLYMTGGKIDKVYENGVFAEIIETISLKDAEKQLGKKIV